MYTSKASIYKVHIRHLHIVAITVLNELSCIKSTETKKSEFSELGCLFSLCCMSTEIHVSDLAIFHLSEYLPSTPLSHIPRVWLIRVPLLYFWGILQDVHVLSAGFCSLSEQNRLCFGGASLCLSSCTGWALLLKPCLCLVLTFILYCPHGLYPAQYPSKTSASVALCLVLTWGKFSLLFASVSSSYFLSLASVCCPHYTSLFLLWCPAVLGFSSLGNFLPWRSFCKFLRPLSSLGSALSRILISPSHSPLVLQDFQL